MANTVIAPIIKSSNDAISRIPTGAYYSGGMIYTYTEAPTVSNALYCAGPSSNLKKMALAWDSSVVPTNKRIVNVTLYVYTINGHSKNIFYRFTSFNEGSSIPSYSPSDGSIVGGAASGWKAINLGATKESSVVIGAALDYKTIYVYVSPQETVPVTVADYWSVYSHRSSINQPYVVITYDDIPPEPPKSLYPSNITTSTRDIIRFAWLHDSKEGLEQAGFTLQYSTDGGTNWTSTSQSTSNQFYDMPANTLPTTGIVTWRVRTRDTEGAESEYSTATFTLGIPPQKAPVPVAPISQYIEESKVTRFEWVFTGGSASDKQGKFDLQYSVDGGTSWTTLTQTTENNYREIPGNTFNAGTITWRVRTYNTWNEVSPYSEAKAFTVIGSPPAPLITTITNSAKPVISWQSTTQQTFQLEISKDGETVYKTGKIPSAEKHYKVSSFLENGTYVAKVRVTNEYNFESPWGEKSFVIDVVKPQKASIEVFNREYSVLVKSDKGGLIYRNNILIGEISEEYEDFTGQNNKEYTYFVRVIDENESFIDSDKMLGYCSFYGATLSQIPSDFVKLKYGMDADPREDSTFSVSANLQHYDGRKYPVAEFSEFTEKSLQLTYHIQSKEEKDRIEAMIESRKQLLLRLSKDNIYGIITGFSDVKNTFGYEVSFSITKTRESHE